MEIQSQFSDVKLDATGEIYYTCYVVNQYLDDDRELKFVGEHKSNRSNYHVTSLYIHKCRNISRIPNGLIKEFPNLQILVISYSNLVKIEADDLRELKNLYGLCLEGNKIENLDDNLFRKMYNLERISFYKNKIKFIAPHVFDNLKCLKYLNLRENVNINKCYDELSNDGNSSLEELREEIKLKCVDNWRFHYENLESDYEKLKHENVQMKMDVDSSHKEIDDLINKLIMTKEENESLKHCQPALYIDLMIYLKNSAFKDFTITIHDQLFHVHKFLLAARSPTISKMIQSSPDACNLNLVDISIETFNEILNYIYHDQMPVSNDVNYKDIFVAAGRLGLKELIHFSGNKLIDSVNLDNAFEMLKLSNLYEHYELRMKSFVEVTKLFPGKELKEELAVQPDKIQKLFECKRKYDESVKTLEREFENACKRFE
jgi:Leucine-rich repeat (LRR) protein